MASVAKLDKYPVERANMHALEGAAHLHLKTSPHGANPHSKDCTWYTEKECLLSEEGHPPAFAKEEENTPGESE